MARIVCALRVVVCFSVWVFLAIGVAHAETRVTSLVPGAAPADTVAAGGLFTCALTTNGRVTCWGDNNKGQLGRDSSVAKDPTPNLVVGVDQVVSLAAGDAHVCALRQNGSVWCWGANDKGQLGDGTTITRRLPVPVAVFPNQGGQSKAGIIRITAGYQHTCAIDSTNTPYCWGDNSVGQCGFTASSATTPTLVPLANVVSIHSGQMSLSTFAVQANGNLFCWGSNSYGECGTGSGKTVETYPVEVPLPFVAVPYSQGTAPVGVSSL